MTAEPLPRVTVRRAGLIAVTAMCWPATVTTMHAQSGTMTLDEARMYFERSGSGRAIVFIHGFALNLREWDDQVKALASAFDVRTRVAILRRRSTR